VTGEKGNNWNSRHQARKSSKSQEGAGFTRKGDVEEPGGGEKHWQSRERVKKSWGRREGLMFGAGRKKGNE